MKRVLFLMLLLLFTATARANGIWDSLWRNADQQGEKMLQQGDAAAAAKTFNDPRHKAYAELQAGDFSNAAKHFAAFDDGNGNYNRGNALAHAGQLEDALKAYDAALASNPKDSDARYNRDLVARALQQQQSRSSSNKDSASKDGKNGGKNQAGQSSQADDKISGKQDGAQNNSAGQNGKEKQGKAGQDNAANGSDRKAGQGQQQPLQSGQAATKNQPDSSAPANGQSQPDDAAQAKRDAEAALGKSPTGKTGAMPDTPVSEQQLAQEQWLRRIPDDPGGLLRRKFMIEHMIRQQGGQQ